MTGNRKSLTPNQRSKGGSGQIKTKKKDKKMKNKAALLIPVEDFCKGLGFCYKHYSKKRDLFIEIDAFVQKEDEDFFSLPKYTKYVFEHLDSSWKAVMENKSHSDLMIFESDVRGYLTEWKTILYHLLKIATDLDFNKEDYNLLCKKVVADYHDIYSRLQPYFELGFDLVCTNQISFTSK